MVEYLREVKTPDDVENLIERLYHEGYDCKEIGLDAPPFHPESISIEGDGKYFTHYNGLRGLTRYYLCLRPGESAIVKRVGKLIARNNVYSWDVMERYTNVNGKIKVEVISENTEVTPKEKPKSLVGAFRGSNPWEQIPITELEGPSRPFNKIPVPGRWDRRRGVEQAH